MINELLKNHSYGAIISKNGGIMWMMEYSQEQLYRIFKNVKYSHYWINASNNDIYIYL